MVESSDEWIGGGGWVVWWMGELCGEWVDKW